MHRPAIAVTLAAAMALSGCQTITEELPSAAPNNPGAPTVIPVIVVPVPVPTPAPVAPPPPPAGPPAPAPTSAPPGAPPPAAPPPAPTNPNDPPGDWPDNTNPVAKLTAKVYFVECFGRMVDYPPAPVGCRIHMDVTPTDSGNRHTRAKGTPQWTWGDRSLFTLSGNSPYNPVLDAKAAGVTSGFAEVDGIRSNTVSIHIQ
jgi:hypothetical protein